MIPISYLSSRGLHVLTIAELAWSTCMTGISSQLLQPNGFRSRNSFTSPYPDFVSVEGAPGEGINRGFLVKKKPAAALLCAVSLYH